MSPYCHQSAINPSAAVIRYPSSAIRHPSIIRYHPLSSVIITATIIAIALSLKHKRKALCAKTHKFAVYPSSANRYRHPLSSSANRYPLTVIR